MIIQQARKGYDAIYLQKVVSLDLFARLKKLSNARLVFDLNDGLWLPSHSGTSNQHILEILKMADSITCDNLYGIAFAKNYNSNTFLVPDPSQVEIFDRYRNTFEKPEARYILGWVGSPSTLFNIFVIWEALEKVFSRNKNILLRLIGTGYNRSLLPRFEQVIYENVPYYTNADMIQHILGMNIGLFPMFDVEDSQIRGILKASVYMSGEAAVIASPRGQITDLIKHGINGFTANNTDEWIKYMELLIRDHALRKSITTAGLETVRLHFSLEKSFNSLLHALGLQHH
jgi:glycosyltransferase involved in cell wall biosynthesis